MYKSLEFHAYIPTNTLPIYKLLNLFVLENKFRKSSVEINKYNSRHTKKGPTKPVIY